MDRPPEQDGARGLPPALEHLCRFAGVEPDYEDGFGVRRAADAEAVVAILRAIDVPIARVGDAEDALERLERERAVRPLPDTVVVWDGNPSAFSLSIPPSAVGRKARLTIELEPSGERIAWDHELGTLPGAPPPRIERLDRFGRLKVRVPLPPLLPFGAHRLRIDGPVGGSTRIFSAPRRCLPAGTVLPTRAWGLFAPLYALRNGRDRGVGDLGTLDGLRRFTSEHGGAVVGTLPLLASFLDRPFAPSPYTPVSRLFWNELYADLDRIPCGGPETAAAHPSSSLLRDAPLVEYRQVMREKRRALEAASRRFFESGGENDPDFARFRDSDPWLERYARFRARVDRTGRTWRRWSARTRGTLPPEDPAVERYHRFVQWVMHRQLADDGTSIREHAGLYLDYPIGVHPDGFDVREWPDLFVDGFSTGAPPDRLFSGGQDWGFPPMHPTRGREDGHAYFRACLARQMRAASVLRIDHVMGLHRLYWVPPGASARDGAYVRYPSGELYAILALESHRHRCVVAGEDLGTVPGAVRAAMDAHGLLRLHVAQLEWDASDGRTLDAPPAGSIASLNTHDTPTAYGFLTAADVEERLKLGLETRRAADAARMRRRALAARLSRALGLDAPSDVELVDAWTDRLAASDARLVLVSLEDLWLERIAQNLPGTGPERANWARKMRIMIQDLEDAPRVARAFERLARLRDEARRRAVPDHEREDR